MISFKEAKHFVRQNSTSRYIIEPPYTIAVVELSNPSTEFAKRVMAGKGLSTCSRSDPWDESMGKNIARGRAEAELARKVMRLDKFYDWIMTYENNTRDSAATTRSTK